MPHWTSDAWRRLTRRWEFWLFVLVVLTVTWGTVASSNFLNLGNLFSIGQQEAVVGLLAIGLTPVVLAGEIDLSITSILEVSLVTMALLWQAGLNIWLAAVAALLTGAVLGFINGVLVVVLGLPSLAVTIGTLVAYSGIALLELGGNAVTGFPTGFVSIGVGTVGQSPVAISVLILASAALVVGIIIHGTRIGTYIYAVGGNKEAAKFSGVPVGAVKIFVFVLSGLLAAAAGVMYAAYLDTAVADAASTDLLTAVTIVLFGGIDFAGGSGSLIGVLMALILIGGLENGLGLLGVPGQVQIVLVGALLILSVSANSLLGGLRLRGTQGKQVSSGGGQG